jgi:hypothetical protein
MNYIGKGGNAVYASSTTVSVSSTVETGEILIVWVTYGTQAASASVSDGVNTFTKIGSTITDAANGDRTEIYQCQSAVGGTRNITLTTNVAAVWKAIAYVRYTGLAGAAQVAGQSQYAPGLATDAVSSGNITPVSTNSLLIGFTFANNGGDPVLTPGTGFTSRGDFPGMVAGFGNTSLIEDKILSGTSPVAATFTTAVNDHHMTMGVVVPLAAAAAAPVISNITVTENSSTSATIGWALDQPATGQIEYGTTNAYGQLSTKESSFNYSSHAQTLTGLTAGTTYHFRLVSTNSGDLTTNSNDFTFTLSGTSADITNITANPVTDTTADINWTSAGDGPSVIEIGTTTAYEQDAVSVEFAPVISNVLVTVNSPTSVTVSWSLNKPATGQIEYGSTTAYGLLSTKESSFNYSSHAQTLNGLTSGAVYHFRIVSTDQAGSTAYSDDLLLTTNNTAPVIANIVVTVDSSSAVTIEWDTDKVATAQVEYGLTDAYGQLSDKDESLTLTHHTRTLTGLSNGVYHFRLASTGQAGITSYSADSTFTTNTLAPVISNVLVTVNSTTSVTISWSLNKPATGQVKYGATSAYGLLSTKESSFDYSSHARTLTGLTPSALYHFSVVSEDASGLSSVSADLTFSTDTVFPVISNNRVSILTPNSVKVIWDLSEFATGQVEYGTTTGYGQLSKKETSFNYNHHEQLLSNLTPGALYHYRIISTDQSGNTTTSADFTFTTNSYSQIAWVAAGQFVSAVGDITVNFPSGYQDDDMAILLVETANQPISTPAGWTLHTNGVTSQGTAGAAGGIRLTMFYKFCSGVQGPVVITDAANHKSALIHIVRGVNKTNPIELINNSTYMQAAPGTSFYFFPITTGGPDRLILFCAAAQYDIDSTTYFGWEDALTERSDNMSSAGIGGGIGVASMPQATAGDAGDRRGFLVNNGNVALLGIVLVQAMPISLVSGHADSVSSQTLDAPDIGIMLGGGYESESSASASVIITVNDDSGVTIPKKPRSYSITINVSDINSQAARAFYREIRTFAERTKSWQTAIFYETKPDERWDLTLVSFRVYGRRDEYLTVMAAAGIDVFEQELKQKQLILPTESQLSAIKRKYGFESVSDLREDFKPTWIN